MSSFETGALGSGIVAALVALVWGVTKILKRSRCQSHTKCCDFDVTRSLTLRADQHTIEMEELRQEIARLKTRDEGERDPPSLSVTVGERMNIPIRHPSQSPLMAENSSSLHQLSKDEPILILNQI